MDIRSFGWLTTRRITNAWALTGVLALVLGAGCILSARAEVRLPSVFCDHIVLQRDKPIRVWGWAPAGETVIVEFSGQTKEAKTDSAGKWQVQLAPLPASTEGKTLVVRSGGVEKKITDVVVGEVWYCAGQSNMALGLGKINTPIEQKEPENPQLRFFTFSRQTGSNPQDDVKNGRWLVVGPNTVGHIFGTAYYFGKMAQKELGVPFGFIQSAVGGTPVEAWMARETLASDPEMDQLAKRELKLYEQGEIKNKEYLAQGGDPAKMPWPEWKICQVPTHLYNGMVHPFTPFTLRGFLWYQAEHNLTNPQLYGKSFPAHIKGWRSAWGQDDLPFYYCQLPGLNLKGWPPKEGNLGIMRLIQAQALALPKTGMAVIYDTAEEADNHPKNKRPHGERLARLALARDYGKAIACSGPVYVASKVEGNHIRVSFSSIESGLAAKEIPQEYRPSSDKPETKPVTRTNPGSQLEGFQLQNEKGEWIWSEAHIDGNDVVVALKEGTTVKAIRYACIDFGFFNLFNKEGLPAAPFEAPVKYGNIGSSWAASPEVQPAEPERLRGLPRPNELPLAQGTFQPTQASLDENYRVPEWFADAKLGFWAHWGPQSVGMNGWYAKRMYDPTFPVNLYQQHIKKFGHPSKVGYKDTIPLFTAEKFDPEGLMAEFKEMGARMFLSMGVHHDNYDMWNSKYHRWNAVKIGPHKDIVGLWQQAAKKQGIRFGVSTHLCPSYDWWNINKSSDKTGPLAGVPYDGMDPANWDLYHPPHQGDQDLRAGWGPERNKDPQWWRDHCFRRMYDLVTTYQPDFVNENDGGKSWGDSYGPTLVAHYYNMSAAKHGGVPDVVWYGKEGNGKGSPPCGEFALPKLSWRHLWEYENSTSGWFWEEGAAPRVDSLVKMFVEVISRNGVFMVSFPQRADGTVPEDHMNCLREMGKWVRLNEDGIFGTRPWRLLGEGPTTLPYDRYKHSKESYFKKDDIRFTRKAGVIYAFLMNPTDDKVLVRALGKKARLADGVPQAVRLLGYEGKLNWSQEDDGLKVELPAAWVGRMIPVIEIRGFAAWDGDIRPGLDGQLVLTANEAQLNGTKLYQVFGRDFVQGWNDPAEWLSWDKAHLLEAGEYDVTIDGGGLRADVPYRLQIGEKELTGNAPASAAWNKGVVFPAGKIAIEKAGVYPVSLRAGSDANWGGLQLFNITLKRIQ